MRISPSSGCSKPAMSRNDVVLPKPDGPRSDRNSPLRTFRLTASTAVREPKRLVTARNSTSKTCVWATPTTCPPSGFPPRGPNLVTSHPHGQSIGALPVSPGVPYRDEHVDPDRHAARGEGVHEWARARRRASRLDRMAWGDHRSHPALRERLEAAPALDRQARAGCHVP